MRTISNIFTLQTTSQYKQCGRRQREERLGRSSWNVNVYCTRAGGCEDKPSYLQNAEGNRDALMVQVADMFMYCWSLWLIGQSNSSETESPSTSVLVHVANFVQVTVDTLWQFYVFGGSSTTTMQTSCQHRFVWWLMYLSCVQEPCTTSQCVQSQYKSTGGLTFPC